MLYNCTIIMLLFSESYILYTNTLIIVSSSQLPPRFIKPLCPCRYTEDYIIHSACCCYYCSVYGRPQELVITPLGKKYHVGAFFSMWGAFFLFIVAFSQMWGAFCLFKGRGLFFGLPPPLQKFLRAPMD